MLLDSFNRQHDYLRISLTDKCNLRCTYCTVENIQQGSKGKSPIMTADEIETMASVFVRLGVNKIRLTGGEPLVRKDAKDIITRLSKYPVELTITTNGVLVDEYLSTFKAAGICSVNVSLDTLSEKRYFSITRRNEYDRALANINLLLQDDYHVKVNVVVMKGINDDEVLNFIEWTKNTPVHIRFIEYMPFSGNEWSSEKMFSHQQLLDLISSKYEIIKLLNEKNDTAKKYFVPKHKGTFAVISTMSEPFCSGCNRMRLTSDGKMYNCLYAKQEMDLLTPLRNGMNIESLIQQCVMNKKAMLGGNNENENWGKMNTETREKSMINLGG